MKTYDVLVVGARCAGASLAAFLAQRGLSVCLIDRASFPSDTISTHVFGHWPLYRRLGVEAAIAGSGAPKITRFRVDMDGCVLEAPTVVTPWVSGLRRIKLDQILLDEACRYDSVDWHPGCELTQVIWEGGRVVGALVSDQGEPREIRARAVVGADGRRSAVARQVETREYVTVEPTRCAYYAYFTGVQPAPLPTFEFYWSNGDLLMVNPCDEDLHCLVVMPPQAEFANWRKQPAESLEAKLHQVPTLAPRLRGAKMVGSVRGAGDLRSYLRHPYGPGWVLVGDAGAATHPCVGTGIDHAVASAEILADSLTRFLRETQTWDEAMESYHTMRDGMIGPTLEAAAHLAELPPVAQQNLGWIRLLCTMPLLANKLGTEAPGVVAQLVSEGARRNMEAMLREEMLFHE